MSLRDIRIDGGRLLESLERLAMLGMTEDGACCRLALTDEDRDGRDLVTLVTQRYVSPPEGEPLRAAAAAGPSASPPTDSEGEGEGGDDPDGPTHLDFDGFLVALLRVGTAPVTAAVFR